MHSVPKTPRSVVAAGIVAIGGGCWALLAVVMMLSLPLRILPNSVQFSATASVFTAMGVFGIFTGLGLFRLKNWARISALIWGGIIVLVSAFAIRLGLMRLASA